ncbi:MAG: asparagine synthase (glutamine-hydrolyzing) [Bacteroidetes bacterium]|nr:asparagine synthase (glutamine-hydrolyzing) [Bacteroidota bacterium]
MCGIVGYFSKAEADHKAHLDKALQALSLRGPDTQVSRILSPHVGFGHARLSIIDTTDCATQPMTDETGRYTIIFNGEIFNYRELRAQFLGDQKFHSSSDTEVLLDLYIKLGEDCLQHLNGFFAFAVYDSVEQSLFIARDRMGIKPLHVYEDNGKIIFASELKAIFAFPISKEIDFDSLALYLQLNYIPGSNSILKHVSRLLPGWYMTIDRTGHQGKAQYYKVPYDDRNLIADTPASYDRAQSELRTLLDASVQRRLVSDVPLGAFLSGGIDSSIVVSLAARHKPDLNTFSIGFKDEPFFDETYYANLVAKKFGTNHTVFSITTEDMYQHLFDILDYLDEPFADSSAIAVYILSMHTRKHVTVSLSGDGGDELFAGYNKHDAELRARKKNLVNTAVKAGLPVWKMLPKSRQSKFTNIFRQLERYGVGLKLSPQERYWRWCAFVDQDDAQRLIRANHSINKADIDQRKEAVLKYVNGKDSINDVLMADTQMVLPNDMLTKVDLMSMANSLEVRVPILDYTVVNYAFTIPTKFKIAGGHTKKILKDAFRDVLPDELYTRPKRGFEVPLLKWFRTGLRSLIEDDLLSDSFIEQQGIFDATEIRLLKKQLFSSDPGEVHARIWGLIVFQYWYKKYFL